MRKRKIGKTGLEVFGIGLGGMPLSIDGRPDVSQAKQVIRTALEAGVDFIDTANVYCINDNDTGHNERLIAETLKELGASKVTVATKGGLTRPDGRWETDGRPEFLRSSCEASLTALGTDSIFLYQLHAPADNTPFEESVGALARLKEEGKIQHVGLSNVSVDQLKAAQEIVRVETVQNRCHPLLSKDYKGGLVSTCEDMNVTFIPHSPVGGYRDHSRLNEQSSLKAMSEKYGVSTYQILLAWHLGKSAWALPIPGASRPVSIQDSAQANELELEGADILAIDSLA